MGSVNVDQSLNIRYLSAASILFDAWILKYERLSLLFIILNKRLTLCTVESHKLINTR